MPSAILNRKLVKKGPNALLQVLVQWTGLPAEASTWENYDTIKTRYPAPPAWDKLKLKRVATSAPMPLLLSTKGDGTGHQKD